MLRLVRFFYTILYYTILYCILGLGVRVGPGDVDVSLLIVFKHLQICKIKGLFHPFALMQSCSYNLLKL